MVINRGLENIQRYNGSGVSVEGGWQNDESKATKG